jgi:hypothetical protein
MLLAGVVPLLSATTARTAAAPSEATPGSGVAAAIGTVGDPTPLLDVQKGVNEIASSPLTFLSHTYENVQAYYTAFGSALKAPLTALTDLIGKASVLARSYLSGDPQLELFARTEFEDQLALTAKVLEKLGPVVGAVNLGLAINELHAATDTADQIAAGLDVISSGLSTFAETVAVDYPPAAVFLERVAALATLTSNGIRGGEWLATQLDKWIHPGSYTVTPDIIQSGKPDLNGVVEGFVVFSNPAGGALFYTNTAPARGTVTVIADGNTARFIYHPAPAAQLDAEAAKHDLSDSFTITATDIKTQQKATTGPIPVDVDPGTPQLGRPPSTKSDPDSNGAVNVTINTTDPANGKVTYIGPMTVPTQGTITNFNSEKGTFTYTPNTDATAGAPVAGTPIVNTPDANTGVVTGSAVFTTPINDSFTVTASNGVNTAPEVIPITTSVNGASNLTYTLTTAPTLGAVTVNDDGTFTYTPTAAARQAALTNPTNDTFTITADPRVITGTNGATSASETITVPVSAADPIIGTWTGPALVSGGDSMAYVGGGVYTIAHLTGDIWGTFTQTGPGTYAGHATIVDIESFTMVLNSDGTELTFYETVSLNGQVVSVSGIATKVQSSPMAPLD